MPLTKEEQANWDAFHGGFKEPDPALADWKPDPDRIPQPAKKSYHLAQARKRQLDYRRLNAVMNYRPEEVIDSGNHGGVDTKKSRTSLDLDDASTKAQTSDASSDEDGAQDNNSHVSNGSSAVDSNSGSPFEAPKNSSGDDDEKKYLLTPSYDADYETDATDRDEPRCLSPTPKTPSLVSSCKSPDASATFEDKPESEDGMLIDDEMMAQGMLTANVLGLDLPEKVVKHHLKVLLNYDAVLAECRTPAARQRYTQAQQVIKMEEFLGIPKEKRASEYELRAMDKGEFDHFFTKVQSAYRQRCDEDRRQHQLREFEGAEQARFGVVDREGLGEEDLGEEDVGGDACNSQDEEDNQVVFKGWQW